jgi:hypothetical protein
MSSAFLARASTPARAARLRHLRALREHRWSTGERVALIAALAIVMGSLFVASYSLALGDPVPHRIDAAVVGDPASRAHTVRAVQSVARDSLVFHRYPSPAAALHAINRQEVYAALDLTSTQPTLYVASAAGASVARLLERVSAVDPSVQVVDAHPLDAHDPNGLDIFYLMLVATIVGLVTTFQVHAHAGPLSRRQWVLFVVSLALAGSLVFTLVEGPLLHRLDLPVPESWGILALQLLAVASFASLLQALIGRWAIVPAWLFFVVLGNSASGGAVAPPLLPHPFAFLSQWLPSGATVTALRDAIYFPDYQQLRPIAVLAIWAAGLFAAMIVATRRVHQRRSAVSPQRGSDDALTSRNSHECC